jgi:hypothetical protein
MPRTKTAETKKSEPKPEPTTTTTTTTTTKKTAVKVKKVKIPLVDPIVSGVKCSKCQETLEPMKQSEFLNEKNKCICQLDKDELLIKCKSLKEKLNNTIDEREDAREKALELFEIAKTKDNVLQYCFFILKNDYKLDDKELKNLYYKINNEEIEEDEEEEEE